VCFLRMAMAGIIAAMNPPTVPFSFEALAEMRARRAGGLSDIWLLEATEGR
jgi:hypothetical protein